MRFTNVVDAYVYGSEQYKQVALRVTGSGYNRTIIATDSVFGLYDPTEERYVWTIPVTANNS